MSSHSVYVCVCVCRQLFIDSIFQNWTLYYSSDAFALDYSDAILCRLPDCGLRLMLLCLPRWLAGRHKRRYDKSTQDSKFISLLLMVFVKNGALYQDR